MAELKKKRFSIWDLSTDEKLAYLVNNRKIKFYTLLRCAVYIDERCHPHKEVYEKHVAPRKANGGPLRLAMKPVWVQLVELAYQRIVGRIPDKEYMTFMAFKAVMGKLGGKMKLKRKTRKAKKMEASLKEHEVRNQEAYSYLDKEDKVMDFSDLEVAAFRPRRKLQPQFTIPRYVPANPGYTDTELISQIETLGLNPETYF